ncbi:Acyltransferase, partial [Opisthorchis viverrini]
GTLGAAHAFLRNVGQKHSGFFGLAEKIISAAVPAVWFDRDEVLDRQRTAARLKEHVMSPNAEPLLIFPEGTCINNTSVMKFKKGCFEVGAPIHPVAIKYNPLFADCFWNSSRDSLLQYTFKIMSSWAMVVDVWYLPPTRMRDDEDGIMFAGRVQQSIANCGGLLNMNWDGELKRQRPKDTLKLAQQLFISRYLVPQEEDKKDT